MLYFTFTERHYSFRSLQLEDVVLRGGDRGPFRGVLLHLRTHPSRDEIFTGKETFSNEVSSKGLSINTERNFSIKRYLVWEIFLK